MDKTEDKIEKVEEKMNLEREASESRSGADARYVVHEQSLRGLHGALVFFMICFALMGMSYIIAFFGAMAGNNTANTINDYYVHSAASGTSATAVVTYIFTPILAIAAIATTVLIAMEKRMAKLAAWITLGVSFIYTTITAIVAYIEVKDAACTGVSSYYAMTHSSCSSTADATALPILIGGILVSLVGHGLIALYFHLSKRVKQTLVKK